MTLPTDLLSRVRTAFDNRNDSPALHCSRWLRTVIVEPPYLYSKLFSGFSRYYGRLYCVYFSQRYTRIFESSSKIAEKGVHDRSKFVRYRSFRCLALNPSNDSLISLEKLDMNALSEDDVANARAAINAIRKKNHHLFLDRDESGRVFIRVNFENEESISARFGPDWNELRSKQNKLIDEEFNQNSIDS